MCHWWCHWCHLSLVSVLSKSLYLIALRRDFYYYMFTYNLFDFKLLSTGFCEHRNDTNFVHCVLFLQSAIFSTYTKYNTTSYPKKIAYNVYIIPQILYFCKIFIPPPLTSPIASSVGVCIEDYRFQKSFGSFLAHQILCSHYYSFSPH